MICGAADGEQTACTRAVEKKLMTPSGPMTLAPAYSGMREDVGKLTQKIPGWNENGSVYCHAATFYAYAMFCAREPEKAFERCAACCRGIGTIAHRPVSAVYPELLPGCGSWPEGRAEQSRPEHRNRLVVLPHRDRHAHGSAGRV